MDHAGTKLYKRNAKGDIIFWEILDMHGALSIRHGLFGSQGHLETFSSKDSAKELKSRVTAKRKSGYKSTGDLRDNAPTFISDSANLKHYLETYLPKDNTTIRGDKFCMLAKTLEDNKPFEKGLYEGQWKINGERCLVGAERTNDMFQPIKLNYQSRRGTDWTPLLSFMDEIIIPCLSENILQNMIEEGVKLDGEIYLPGYNINQINHFIKDPTCPQHQLLQYWIYDIAMECMSSEYRQETLAAQIDSEYLDINSKEEHLNNKRQLVVLPSIYVKDYEAAIETRDRYISLGFEGLILRNTDAEYQFGVRNSAMFKFKKIYDGYFEIIDIVPQKKKEELPLFILRNDINEETFECTINVSHAMQTVFLINKHNYIGLKAFVEYRERSGVKEVPFHAKIIKVMLELAQPKYPEDKVKHIKQTTKMIKQKKIKFKL